LKKYCCQRRDDSGKMCGLECVYVKAVLEYAVLRSEKLTRKPAGVKRVLWVDCPVHGRVVYEHMGHHVTMGWKKTPKRPNAPQK
jgi:hypothetical protein